LDASTRYVELFEPHPRSRRSPKSLAAFFAQAAQTPMNNLPAKSRTLILVNHPGRQKRQDFEEIKAKIEAIAPNIDVRIVEAGGPANEIDEHAWQRPCLVVSFATPICFRPKRGLIYCCRQIPKFQQL
jgi:ribonuclease D